MLKELEFEKELIAFLCNEVSSPSPQVIGLDSMLHNKKWTYLGHIRSEEALWNNFKKHVERLNTKVLEGKELTPFEFTQVKEPIEKLNNPYEAGKFLYGLNGVCQVGVNREDGSMLILTLFNQRDEAALQNSFEIVNQVERGSGAYGDNERRFDVTLLINGLPLIQLELKKADVDVKTALNQMEQYVNERRYSGIFSTVQMLVAMTPYNVKYMANASPGFFNKDFAFHWQTRESSDKVRDWKKFATLVLNPTMALQMATQFIILDGTPNKQCLKIMRPYQVYATQEVIARLKQHDFNGPDKRVGYVWHTTGSGKTITSYKTAWLASRLPHVDKVVFVVDRLALTKQTYEQYKAYDPESDGTGSIEDTIRTDDLRKKLETNTNNIIITSVQKLLRLVEQDKYEYHGKNIVFIVDEAHRSTAGEGFKRIQERFSRAAWIGYTGTPHFEGITTRDIFGDLLHAYTIKEAIADNNVLGFDVVFKSTIDLRALVKSKYPYYTELQVDEELEAMREEEFEFASLLDGDVADRATAKGELIERSLKTNFYDTNINHVRKVVEDIYDNWPSRSGNYKYNAILTTHVSGRSASTPLASEYFKEFVKQSRVRITGEEGKKFSSIERPLKIALTFSFSVNNSDSMPITNKALREAINYYNEQFGTHFSVENMQEYLDDVYSRLRQTHSSKQYLDLVIVVDQLLTGFDAPTVNTLYVDRILRGAGLIQAYSRTNRIIDMNSKQFGQIVNYRWPEHNRNLMNKALATYANRDSANLSVEECEKENRANGTLTIPYEERIENLRVLASRLAELTMNKAGEPFMEIPEKESEQEETYRLLNKYNREQNACKFYCSEPNSDGFQGYRDGANRDIFLAQYGMETEKEVRLQTVIRSELRQAIARRKGVETSEVSLVMSYVSETKINIDYLSQLLEDLVNEVNANDTAAVEQTERKIQKIADSQDTVAEADTIINAVNAIKNKMFPQVSPGKKFTLEEYESTEVFIKLASQATIEQKVAAFIRKWGLEGHITASSLIDICRNYDGVAEGLNSDGKLGNLVAASSVNYKEQINIAPEVKELTKIKYRNTLWEEVNELAKKIEPFI